MTTRTDTGTSRQGLSQNQSSRERDRSGLPHFHTALRGFRQGTLEPGLGEKGVLE